MNNNNDLYKSVNWNEIEDDMDKVIWDTIKSQIWYPDELPIVDDKHSWRGLTDAERTALIKCFAGLTRLDTLQTFGVSTLMGTASTLHEDAVLAAFSFFEAIHASSYSFINQTLLTTPEIIEAHEWADNDPFLSKKIEIIQRIYEEMDDTDPTIGFKKRAVSALLESCLFFTGFYLPLYLSGSSEMTATGDLIKLIVRDETIHGGYISYKARELYDGYTDEQRAECDEFVYTNLADLMDLETQYTAELYGDIGLTEEVNKFLSYNADKTLQNLGFPPLSADSKPDFNAVVFNALNTVNQNHDFFSKKGSSYLSIEMGVTSDVNWGKSVEDYM